MKSFWKNEIVLHVVFWIFYFFLLTWFYYDMGDMNIALKRSSMLILFQAIVFYINLLILLPVFFEKNNYFLYILLVVVLLVSFAVLFNIIDREIFMRMGDKMKDFRNFHGRPDNNHEPFNRPPPEHGGRLGKFFFMYKRTISNGFSLLVMLFVSTIYRNIKVNLEREQEAIKLQNQVLEAESKMLKWQINPHFLFNTLNNIYSLAQIKSDKTPDCIHRLSKMLSYVIYDCNEKYVELGKEIDYLKSYIELQLLKDDQIKNIQYDFNDADPSLKIAPLLFITFVENSFKHCNISDIENSWVKIELTTLKKLCNFKISNSISVQPVSKDQTQGIGLDNVKRRLDLIYPDRHELNIKEEKDSFYVELTIYT